MDKLYAQSDWQFESTAPVFDEMAEAAKQMAEFCSDDDAAVILSPPYQITVRIACSSLLDLVCAGETFSEIANAMAQVRRDYTAENELLIDNQIRTEHWFSLLDATGNVIESHIDIKKAPRF